MLCYYPDVKPANLLVSIEQSTDTISDYLRKVPAEEYPIRHDPEVSQDPIHTIVSQPLPNFGLDPAGSNLELKLADFGHGEIHPHGQFTFDLTHSL